MSGMGFRTTVITTVLLLSLRLPTTSVVFVMIKITIINYFLELKSIFVTLGAYASGDVMHSCSDKIHTHRASMQFAKGTDES